jgi:hypothetical protein
MSCFYCSKSRKLIGQFLWSASVASAIWGAADFSGGLATCLGRPDFDGDLEGCAAGGIRRTAGYDRESVLCNGSLKGRLDVAAVLSSLYPAGTMLLALWLLKERATRSQMTRMVLALAAVALISI